MMNATDMARFDNSESHPKHSPVDDDCHDLDCGGRPRDVRFPL